MIWIPDHIRGVGRRVAGVVRVGARGEDRPAGSPRRDDALAECCRRREAQFQRASRGREILSWDRSQAAPSAARALADPMETSQKARQKRRN